jgi:hypothetical protein
MQQKQAFAAVCPGVPLSRAPQDRVREPSFHESAATTTLHRSRRASVLYRSISTSCSRSGSSRTRNKVRNERNDTSELTLAPKCPASLVPDRQILPSVLLPKNCPHLCGFSVSLQGCTPQLSQIDNRSSCVRDGKVQAEQKFEPVRPAFRVQGSGTVGRRVICASPMACAAVPGARQTKRRSRERLRAHRRISLNRTAPWLSRSAPTRRFHRHRVERDGKFFTTASAMSFTSTRF